MTTPLPTSADDSAFVPIPVGELELSEDAPGPGPNALGQVSVLVRIHGIPLGTLNLLEPSPQSALDLPARAVEKFSDELTTHLRRDGLDTVDLLSAARATRSGPCTSATTPSTVSATVVVCTLGEDPRLTRTVQSILAQTHDAFELLVVDNNPGSGRVRSLLAESTDPRLRIVDQPRRGLSAARNAGAAAATGRVIAYTDDDAFADPDWLRWLLVPFAESPSVVCVTGLVLPAELDTKAQQWFEEFGAFDKGFERVVWAAGNGSGDVDRLGRRGVGGALFPYSAGIFGSGNNMAFDADWLRGNPLFDEALGAGTIARGGEDLDAFLTVMLAGDVLVYEPRAVVKHSARREFADLRKQMYGYGSGMSAVLAKQVLAGPRNAGRILARVPSGVRKLLDPRSEKNESRSPEFPRELGRAELAGWAAGPALYLRSRRRARRAAASAH